MIGLILSHLAALVLGAIIGFMISSLCVASSANGIDEEDDQMFEFINKCFENGVSVTFERDNNTPQHPVKVTLTKSNYRLDRVFTQPEISYLTNDEDIFKGVLLGCLDELLNYDLDTMFKENIKPIIW